MNAKKRLKVGRKMNPTKAAAGVRQLFRQLETANEKQQLRLRKRIRTRLVELSGARNADEIHQELAKPSNFQELVAAGDLRAASQMFIQQATKVQPSVRRAFTLACLRRNRALRQSFDETTGDVTYLPVEHPIFEDPEKPVLGPIEHHDVLVVAPVGVHDDREFYRFPVNKTHEHGCSDTADDPLPRGVGTYTHPPELLDSYDYGQRKILSVARPQEYGTTSVEPNQSKRGPAFATLPIKQEPGATSCVVCYLLNAQNLNYRNAWTAEEWSDPPDDPLGASNLPPAVGVDAKDFEALLAGPRGKVFRVSVSGVDKWQADGPVTLVPGSANGASATVECLDLRSNVEVWQQLRNGCVVGRVLVQDDPPKVVPLVNITSLSPELEPVEAAGGDAPASGSSRPSKGTQRGL